MATKRIKDISTTATTFAADDFIALDASSVGTRKMAKASLITQVGANYLEKADNLSDVASKDTSKLNLEVPNVGTAANEVSVNGMLGDMSFQSSAAVTVDDLTVDGQLTAAVGKPMPVNGPTMRFDGIDDYVEFAAPVGSAFSFTNGTDDTPFSISAWVKMEDATNFPVLSKYSTTTAAREWLFYVSGSDYLGAVLMGSDGNTASVISDELITNREGQWTHLSMTYAGAGPNSSNSFSSASGSLELYINGKLQPNVTRSSASYVGMQNTSQPVELARFNNGTEAKGEIRDVKLFNKELSAAEVREVYSNGQLPNSFSESTGGADGGIYTQDATPSGEWSGSAGTEADEAGPIGGRSNILKFTNDGTLGQHLVENTSIGTPVGKRYRVEFYYYIPSTNSNIDGLDVNDRVTLGKVGTVASATLDAWTKFSGEYVATNNQLGINALDGGVSSYQDAGADDVFYIDGLTVTQIGSVLDARAEQFDTSTGKLYDLSGNGFVGTQSGGVSLLGRKFPVYETGTWSGVYTPSTGSFTTMTMDTDLVYTRIGNICTVTGVVQSDDVDATGASGSLRIDGLPFAASKVSVCQIGYAWAWGVNYPISGAISGSSIYLYKRTSSTAQTDDINVTDLTTGTTNNRNVLYISATYKIQ